MSVIHRYISGSFSKYFGLVLLMVVAIYLSIDFFGKIDNFMASTLKAIEIFLYFVYKIPLIISQITPVGVLIAVLIVFGLMNRQNEIIALKSSGISPFYLLRPVVALGIIITLGLFVFSEIVVPVGISRANRIEEKEKESPDRQVVARSGIWIRHKTGLAHIKYFHPGDQVLHGISIYILDDDFNLVRRIDAKRGEYVDGKWILHESMVQSLNGPGDAMRIEYEETVAAPLDLVPSDFQRVIRESEEMNFRELWNYIQRVESEGYDATEYRVDFHGKIAFPFVCLIMALMGSAIALRGKTRDGMAVSFAYGILTAALYWSVYSFSLSLGYGGVLPPWLAAWTADILFGLAAGLMLLNLE